MANSTITPTPSRAPVVGAYRPVSDERRSWIWPRMFGALALALRVRHVVLGIATVIAVGTLSKLPALWGWLGAAEFGEAARPLDLARNSAAMGWRQVVTGITNLDGGVVASGLGLLTIELPSRLLADHPLVTLGTLLPLALAWSLGGGAISRSVAVEYASGSRLTLAESMRFALRHAVSMMAALLFPLVVLALLQVLMAALGRWGLAHADSSPAAAILFGIPLALSLVFVLLALASGLTTHAAVSSVACEATDAIDASQRIYAYVVLRPLRFLAYVALLGLMVAVSACVVMLIAESVVRIAATSVARWVPQAPLAGESPGGILGFWLWLPRLIGTGIVVSVYFSGSTLLYLFLRQINDGQHPADLWTPVMIAGTRAPATPKAAKASPGAPDADEDDGL